MNSAAALKAIRTAAQKARGAAEHALPLKTKLDRQYRIETAREPRMDATRLGEAADLYAYSDRELRPFGDTMTAAVRDFPSGKPGDVGLTISLG
jgi:hypothetical protein